MCLQQDSTTYIYLIYIRQKLSIKYFMLTLTVRLRSTVSELSVFAHAWIALMHLPQVGD